MIERLQGQVASAVKVMDDSRNDMHTCMSVVPKSHRVLVFCRNQIHCILSCPMYYDLRYIYLMYTPYSVLAAWCGAQESQRALFY